MEDCIHGVQLGRHRVCGRGIAGIDHHQLPALLAEHVLEVLRDEEVRNAHAQHLVEGHHGGDAGDLLHPALQLPHVGGAEVVPEDHEMTGRHIEIVLQLLVADDGRKVPGQGFVQLVVDVRVALGVDRREKQQHCQHHQGDLVPEDEGVDLIEGGNQGLVLVLSDLLVEYQHQGRQDQDHRRHPQDHALGHDDADVPSQGQPHEAQGQEARDGGHAAAGEGAESGDDGLGHGVPLVVIALPLLLVAVVEEDGVVHGHAQLQHGGDGFGDVGNLA